MNISDFPMDWPEGLSCNQLGGFDLKVIDPSREEGRCETCHHTLSTHIFNVGMQMHHLCKGCFEKMMRTFADKGGFMLVNKPEVERRVEGHFDFTSSKEKNEDCNIVYRHRDCIFWSNCAHCAKWKSNCCPQVCKDYRKY